MKNKFIVCKTSWKDIVADMSEKESGQLFKAIFAYYKDKYNGKACNLPNTYLKIDAGSRVRTAFAFIKKEIDEMNNEDTLH